MLTNRTQNSPNVNMGVCPPNVPPNVPRKCPRMTKTGPVIIPGPHILNHFIWYYFFLSFGLLSLVSFPPPAFALSASLFFFSSP
jgi:hypothetical protein